MSILKERRKLNRILKKSNTIFLMAHKNLDLDALGSSIGMYQILKKNTILFAFFIRKYVTVQSKNSKISEFVLTFYYATITLSLNADIKVLNISLFCFL